LKFFDVARDRRGIEGGLLSADNECVGAEVLLE
jgi:hypothetical protein